MNKIKLSSMYGQFKEKNLTHEDVEKMYEKIALISGWSLEKARQTPYVQIMDKLVKTIEYYETLAEHNRFNWEKVNERLQDTEKLCKMQDETIQEQTEKIEYFNKHIEALKIIKQGDKETKQILLDENRRLKNQLKIKDDVIASVDKFLTNFVGGVNK